MVGTKPAQFNQCLLALLNQLLSVDCNIKSITGFVPMIDQTVLKLVKLVGS